MTFGQENYVQDIWNRMLTIRAGLEIIHDLLILYRKSSEGIWNCRPVEEYFNIQGIFRRKFNRED
jgi:hypothetical protein